MSGWSRTTSPGTSDPGVLGKHVSGNVYGVSIPSADNTPGVAQQGWVWKNALRKTRIQYETLVAMSVPPTESLLTETLFPDATILITTQPSSVTSQAPAATSFTVVATTNPLVGPTPTGLYVLSYQWQISTDNGVTWNNQANSGVYSNATTATLNISASTGLTGNQYRCVLTLPYSTAPSVTTIPAILTVNSAPTTTVAPTTAAPTTTVAPTTTTVAPTTAAPTTTVAPTTAAPTTTVAPTTTTAAPTTTVAPTTLAPTTTLTPTTTAAPTTTVAPTTLAPTTTTVAPTTTTTAAPTTTVAPTTVAPTTTTTNGPF